MAAMNLHRRVSPGRVVLALALAAGCQSSLDSEGVSPPASLVALQPEPRSWTRLAPDSVTDLNLPRRRTAALAGPWVERHTLWDDAALLFRRDHELCVLEGGHSTPRRIWGNSEPKRSQTLLRNAAWSGDGSTLYIWLSQRRQLCSIDTRTGRVRELLELGTRSYFWDPWRMTDTVDPQPKWRPSGSVVDDDAGRLLFLLEEEPNSRVELWQRRWNRGGAWLAELDLAHDKFRPLFEKSVIPRGAQSWDLALPSGLLYTLTSTEDRDASNLPVQQIQERRLDGTLVRVFGQPPGRAAALELSPDDRRLLVQREYEPGIELPAFGREHTLDEAKFITASRDGGFLILDLESGQTVDGPLDGGEARWAPDGDRIALIHGWGVSLCTVSEQTMTPLIVGGPKETDWYWETWNQPVWSADGRRLAITAPSLDWTLLLDLSSREYLVIGDDTSGKRWAPMPHPFADMPVPDGGS